MRLIALVLLVLLISITVSGQEPPLPPAKMLSCQDIAEVYNKAVVRMNRQAEIIRNYEQIMLIQRNKPSKTCKILTLGLGECK